MEDHQKPPGNALRDQSLSTTWKARMNRHKVGSAEPLVGPFASIFCTMTGMCPLGTFLVCVVF
jgi:hypothetical protein